jgi:hypothetical protein
MRNTITGNVRRNVVASLALIATFAVGLKSGGPRPSGSATVARFELTGSNDPAGSTDPAESGGPGNIGARARTTSSVVAKHGGWTDIPLSGNPWTQSSQELELVAGTVQFRIPARCTGAFGNALVLSVDGTATTFASAPSAPASGTLTVPFIIGTLSEPGHEAQHKLSARFGNSCTKDGEDYTIKDVKVDVLKFH